MLSPDDERDLHQRLLDGDETASELIARACYAPVFERLARRHRGVRDEALLHDAVTDALLNYVERPETYKPALMGLVSYLAMSARRDLLTMLDREGRRRRRTAPLEAVEHLHPVGNGIQDDDEFELPPGITKEQALAAFTERFKDPLDARLVRQIYIEEERDTEVYARLLGFEHLDPLTQRKAVKRHKDRIKKMMERLGERLRGPATS